MIDTALKPVRRWRYRRWLIIAILAYLGAFAFILAMESQFVYQPSTQAQYWAPKPCKDCDDIALTSAMGDKIHCWWFPKQDSKLFVLYSHGNALNLSLWGHAMTEWRENLDASVLIYDFPGYGCSSGAPTEAGCYAAAEAAWEWLTKQKGVEPTQIVLAGESLGSGPAVELAMRHPCHALVLMKAFTSIPDMASAVFPMFPGKYFARTRFDNESKLRKFDRMLFVYHGRHDELVPFEHGERLFKVAAGPKVMYADPDGTHLSSMPKEAFSGLKQFLDNQEK